MKPTFFSRLLLSLKVKFVFVTVLILSPFILYAQQADFAIFFSPDDLQERNAITNIIKGSNDVRIIQCQTAQEVVDSDAKVLVLFMDYKEDKNFNEKQLEALKSYKIIGIDIGAAQLYKRLGLEINGGNCIHDYITLAPKIHMVENPLLDVSKHPKKITVFKLASNDDPINKNINFAMNAHPKSHLRKYVDAIATWEDGINAPIVKQGNCILVGIAAPTNSWTVEFKNLFHDISLAMLKETLKPFQTSQWEITEAGNLSFKLAKLKDENEVDEKTFYFKFNKPTEFKVHLENSNSNHLTLVFFNENGKKHWSRLDAENGEPLDLNINITQGDIESVGDNYWKLDVINFDHKHIADCKMKIEY